jgi:isoleucyl-tRNA synthetase
MPFLAEELYRNLVGSVNTDAPESVHLTFWPEADKSLIDETLMDEMGVVSRLVSLGLSARNSANVKVRQPLAEVAFSLPSEHAGAVNRYADVIMDELNVKAVSVLDKAEEVVTYSLNPLPSALGPRFKDDFPALQKLLRDNAEADSYALQLLAGKSLTLSFDGQNVTISPAEVEVRSNPAEGYAVVSDMQYLAALKTTLTDDLKAEGLAREFIRRVQVLRQEADFNIDDRIITAYDASDQLRNAVRQFAEMIMRETLSEELLESSRINGDHTVEDNFDGETLRLAVKRK